ncbi:hypothetical protein I7I50_11503 [Histoplasma capsulatum G186AR]|uniref:Uncharacterized protein n=1 Tax=Ajellomyces capsulatus TaxID=5037 RepID=A0A8H8D9B4_AJECA|nr:hypothetical protein I7I52_02740 [Histoplasma capsulatum]QSS70011.1 hypothetical protein I7I50_11503 [Histoplasma capsulatum G186AR]
MMIFFLQSSSYQHSWWHGGSHDCALATPRGLVYRYNRKPNNRAHNERLTAPSVTSESMISDQSFLATGPSSTSFPPSASTSFHLRLLLVLLGSSIIFPSTSSSSSFKAKFNIKAIKPAITNPVAITSSTASIKPFFALLFPLYVNTNENHSGTSVAPTPNAKAADRINRFLLVNFTVDMIRIPDTVTDANRKVVIPPNTAEGIATSAAANLENIPISTRKKQQQ